MFFIPLLWASIPATAYRVAREEQPLDGSFQWLGITVLSGLDLIQHSFVPDPSSATLVRNKRKIFDFDVGDVDLNYFGGLHGLQPKYGTPYTSLTEVSQQLSEEAKLDPSTRFFSATVGSAVRPVGLSLRNRQMIAIEEFKSSQALAIPKVFGSSALMSKLRPDVRRLIEDASAETILQNLGYFFPTQMTLGGIIQVRFQKDKGTAADSLRSFARQIRANAKNWTAMAYGITPFITDSDEPVRVTVHAAGGNKYALNGHADFDTKVREWLSTIDADNHETWAPISFSFRPIWTLVDPIDAEKGQRIRTILQEQWDRDDAELLRLENLPEKNEQQ